MLPFPYSVLNVFQKVKNPFNSPLHFFFFIILLTSFIIVYESYDKQEIEK